MVAERVIEDHEVLSQHGTKRADGTFKFTDRLRSDKEPPELDVSLILGKATANEAGDIRIRGARDPRGRARDAVRLTTAGTLRAAGFRVVHTPRRLNPRHVSVYFDQEWDDGVADAFSACFGKGVGVDG